MVFQRFSLLRQILDAYIEHQKEVWLVVLKFDKEKAEARAHILEGLLIALDHIDEVIRIIRASENRPRSASGIDEQVQAIWTFKAKQS